MNNLDYGIIGNCRSAALISREGSIDWLCLPSFDSASVFAALLDKKKGGLFRILPVAKTHSSQSYVSHTNILRTVYDCQSGRFEVLDFMPRYHLDDATRYAPPDVIRRIRVISGEPRIRIQYSPKLNYARGDTRNHIDGNAIKSISKTEPYESIYLYSNLPLESILSGDEIPLEKENFFYLSYNQKLSRMSSETIEMEYDRTKVYWRMWAARTQLPSLYKENIERSALTLKLLTYQRTGALLAAVTTSIPECLNGERNWDYRFCWIRDASMAINILNQLGHPEAARHFLQFVLDVVPFKNHKVQIMYGIRGQKKLTERELDWLEGYEGAKPVRVGNAAWRQKQNDIFGVLTDVLHQTISLYGQSLEYCEDLWTITRSLIRDVKNSWRKPDRSIWEFRSAPRHYTFSRVLCWVAADRGARIARLLGQNSYAKEWFRLARKIHDDVMKNGWSEDRGAFTQSYGDDALDAANLLMAHYHFIEPLDHRYIATVHKTMEELSRDGLMLRYSNADDFGFSKTSFTICTFWMVKSLALIGETEKARRIYEKVLSYGNHLGLFSEGIDTVTKRLLGNFPQAYSHLALIDAGLALTKRESAIGTQDQHTEPQAFDLVGALDKPGT